MRHGPAPMILADIPWLNISINLLLVLQAVVALLLVMIVMMQRPKQEGLGAAFGSGMTDQMFGARTTGVLQKGTVYLGTLFFALALVLAILIGKKNQGTTLTSPETEVTASTAGVEVVPGEDVLPGDDGSATGAESLKEELEKIEDETRAAEDRLEAEQSAPEEEAAVGEPVDAPDSEEAAPTSVDEAPAEETPAPAVEEAPADEAPANNPAGE